MSEETQSTPPVDASSSTPVESDVSRPAEASAAEERVLSRAERRAERREQRGGAAPWLGGAILIVLGLIFLAQNFSDASFLRNWWAIFILIPAFGALAAGWRKVQAAGGSMPSDAIGSFIGGLVLTAIAVVFLFDLSSKMNLIWPVLLILGGLAVLLQAVARR